MGKKKDGRGRKPGLPTESVGARYPTHLVALLDQLVTKNRRTRTIELTMALEAHLKAAGYDITPPKNTRPADGEGA